MSQFVGDNVRVASTPEEKEVCKIVDRVAIEAVDSLVKKIIIKFKGEADNGKELPEGFAERLDDSMKNTLLMLGGSIICHVAEIAKKDGTGNMVRHIPEIIVRMMAQRGIVDAKFVAVERETAGDAGKN